MNTLARSACACPPANDREAFGARALVVLVATLGAVIWSCSEEAAEVSVDAGAEVGQGGDATATSGDVAGTLCSSAADCPKSDNQCELPYCQASGTCTSIVVCACQDDADCAPWDDGDPCNGVMICDTTGRKPGCRVDAASVVACPEGGVCLKSVCDPADGLCKAAPANDDAPCDLGDECLIQTICEAGACVGGLDVCGCHDTADCENLDDEDLCNGTLYCDKSAGSWPWHCKVNPSTVVSCPAPQDGCSVSTCDSTSGACHLASSPTGTACDDGDVCTAGDTCFAGVCVPGSDDVCACSSTADCAALENGDACDGSLYCNLSLSPPACVLNPATVVSCPTGADSTCLKNVCYPNLGLCQPAPVAKTKQVCKDGASCHWQLLGPGDPAAQPTPCDDGDPCSTGEACKAGACGGGVDVCGCEEDADCIGQEDGALCNGTLFCNKQTQLCAVNPKTIVFCPTAADTDCTKNACIPLSGECTPTAIGMTDKHCDELAGGSKCRFQIKPPGAPEAIGFPCEDGDKCTAGDACEGATCQAGTFTCLCKTDADCIDLDDGDLCNGLLFCELATKKCTFNPASVVQCPTVGDSDCTHNVCVAATGKCKMTPVDEDGLCEDGNVCTVGDTCSAGTCKAGSNICECQNNADCAAKEDGNVCNGTLYCDKSGEKPQCLLNPATIVVCNIDTGSSCLKGVCNPKDGSCGQAPTAEGAPCDDNSLCTATDTCDGGVCTGNVIDCDDGNACTNDSCTPAKGCLHPIANCDDGNSCTKDLCDPGSGKCSFAADLLEGALCDADESGCTLNDTCEEGLCKMGTPIICDLPAKVCEAAVCVPNGAKSYACEVVALAKGAPCEDDVACSVSASCDKGKCSGAGKERLFVKVIYPPAGEGGFLAVTHHVDGDFALAGGLHDVKDGEEVEHRWWVARTDAAGDLRWEVVLNGKGDHPEQKAQAIEALPGGHVWVAGGLKGDAGDLNAVVARIDHKGKVLWQQAYGSDDGDEAARALVPDAQGGLLLAGVRMASEVTAAWATKVAASGQTVWTVEVADPKLIREIRAAARRTEGGWLLAGRQLDKASGDEWGLIVPIDAQGKADTPLLFEVAGHGRFEDLAVLADGSVHLAGSRCPVATPCSWQLGLDSDLGVRWQAEPTDGAMLRTVVPLGSGRVALAGYRQPLGSQKGAWLHATDLFGNQQWTKTYADGAEGLAEDATPTTSDGLVVAGSRLEGGKRVGLIVRTSPWGHKTCAEAGTCLDVQAGACADGDGCSIDWCDGKQGCKSAVTDKLRCDPGDSCSPLSSCAAGVCQQTPSGRLWTADAPAGEGAGNFVFGSTAALANGNIAVTGQAIDGGKHSAVTHVFDPKGKHVCSDAFQVGAGNTFGVAVVPNGPDGAMTVLARGASGSAYRHIGAACDDGKSASGGVLTGATPWSMVAYPDTTLGYVLQKNVNYWNNSILIGRYWPSGALKWTSQPLGLGTCKKDNNHWCAWGAMATTSTVATGQGHIWGPRAKANSALNTTIFATINSSCCPGGGQRGWVGRISSEGKANWATQLVTAGTDWIMGGDTLADDGAIAVGVRDLGIHNCWMVRLNAAGGMEWQESWPYGGLCQLWDAHALPDLSYYALGQVQHDGDYRAYIVHAAATGQLLWQKRWDDSMGPGKVIRGLPGASDILAGVAIGGVLGGKIGRVDQWGHRGCEEAGTCAGKTAASCEDGQSCTFDYCMGGVGCSQTALTGCQ